MEAVIREGKLRMQTTESSCDVILSCQGHRLMAHKVILSIASPMLRNLLVQELSEPSVLIFPDINSNTMSLILDYIYTGSVVVYSNTIKDFLATAELLKLSIDMKSNQTIRISEVVSKKNQRKLPNLVPIGDLQNNNNNNINNKKLKENNHKKLISCLIPSPWCSRGMSVLSDPRSYCSSIDSTQNMYAAASAEKPEENNDPNNNNSQKASSLYQALAQNLLPTRTIKTASVSKSNSLELDLTRPFNKIHTSKNLPQENNNIKTETKIEIDDGKEEKKENVDDKSLTSTTTTLNLKSKHDSNAVVAIKNECVTSEDCSKQKPFKCDDCGKCFSQLRNYKYHRSVHEGTKEFAAECPECGKIFNDRGYLSSHMKIHRDRKEYACPYCPKRFNQRVAYNMHLRIHTGIKPHECPTCGKTFSRKMLLKQHQRVHTGERPYSCPECGKTFADRSNMSLHARLHTGVKPYACNLCPKSFTKKHHLKTHMNFHTGLKPYTCEKCGLAFSQSSNMRTHYKKCILKDRPGPSSISGGMDVDSNSSDAK